MASDPTRTVSKQVRISFPDGLPRGLDASQVKLVVHSPERQIDSAEQNRDGSGAVATDRVAAAEQSPAQHDGNATTADNLPASLPGQNEPEPVAAGPCPPTETPEAKRTQATGHNAPFPYLLHSTF